MTFIDLQFGIFLLVSILLFYLCPVKQRWKVLLLVSLVFYAIAGLRYLPFIFVTSFTVYYAGCRMGKVYEALEKELAEKELDRKEKKLKKEQAKQVCKRIMLLALVGNLVILCIVKFTKFFIDPINHLLMAVGGNGTFTAADIIVPLGISYYTFSALSYLLDVYWKRVEYEKSYSRFLLYLIYFPHILQGPIEHYGRLGQRLKKELTFDYDRVCKGIQLMLYGYFKKLVIADRINPFITTAYQNHNTTAGSILLLAMFLDVVYIYADFSGCMDIGRGVSEIFGIEMDLNFNHPFSSKTVTEFWRRWHISLSKWFRDYVYIPLGGSRVSIPRNILNLAIVWLLTGIWHGASYSFIVWGIMYFVALVIEKYVVKPQTHENVVFGLLYRIAVLLYINFGWVIFNADGIKQGVRYWLSMAGAYYANPLTDTMVVRMMREYGVFLAAGILFATPIAKCLADKLSKYKVVRLCIIPAFYIGGGAWAVSYLILGAHNPFIYFNF